MRETRPRTPFPDKNEAVLDTASEIWRNQDENLDDKFLYFVR